MPMIKCPDCGKDISDQAPQCPNCGRPISTQYQYQGQANQSKIICPKCKSNNVLVQNVQTGNIGATQNKVYIQEPKRSKGCLYWLVIGWWLAPIKFICWDMWVGLLFGHNKNSGVNLSANKSINKTMAICQNCGNKWNV